MHITNISSMDKNKNIIIRKSQSVDSLLKEASKHPLLTIEESVMLAKRVQKGDGDAMKRLYEANLRFVVSVAKQYLDRGKTLEELIETGNKGLELAAKKFDPQRGFKFIAYAVWFIRASILAFLATPKNDTNLSDLTEEEKRELVSRMSNERDKEILTRWFGFVDSPESLDEIGHSLNLTTRRIEQLKERAIARLVENGKKYHRMSATPMDIG